MPTTVPSSKGQVIIQCYLEDFDDLSVALERLRDPADETVNWREARRALLAAD